MLKCSFKAPFSAHPGNNIFVHLFVVIFVSLCCHFASLCRRLIDFPTRNVNSHPVGLVRNPSIILTSKLCIKKKSLLDSRGGKIKTRVYLVSSATAFHTVLVLFKLYHQKLFHLKRINSLIAGKLQDTCV